MLWGMSFDQARELAAAEKKPILIDFTGVNCANCRLMERRVLPRPEVVSLLKKFVTVQLYTDFVPIASITADQREELAELKPGTHPRSWPRKRPIPSTWSSPRVAKCSPDRRLQRTAGLRRFPDQGPGESCQRT